MQLRSIECAGYKAFDQHTHLPLPKLAVLFGKNNSGKTTLARLPLFAAGSLSNHSSLYSLTAANQIFGSSFTDLASANQAHPRISFGIAWSKNRRIRIDLQHITSTERGENVQPTYVEIDNDVRKSIELQSDFTGPASQAIESALTPAQYKRFRERTQRAQNALRRIVHIPSHRPTLERAYTARPYAGWTPDEVPYILSSDRTVLALVDNWFKVNLDGAGIAVDQAAFAIRLVETRGNIPTNIVDSGRGLQSVLPVITLLCSISQSRAEPPLIVIEEPEEHLHPSVHGAVMDLIISCSERSQIIVETHSENLILRLRRRIAEKKIAPDRAGLFYIDDRHNITRVALDSTGGTSNWPSGIFESDIAEAQAIVEAKISALEQLGK
jgi:predicted ATPase